jgi:Holliday junction resolvasome RuvABC endonuclease subunit
LSLDASDALAVALCHIHHQQTQQRMQRLAGKVL